MTDVDIQAALPEETLVALTIWGEARGESIAAQVGVGSVIRNRVRSGRFGADYRAVCLQRLQFSCWWPEGGKANYRLLMELAGQIVNKLEVGVGPQWLQCQYIADGIRSGVLLDNVRGATHYHATYVMPAWTKGHRPVVTLDGHLFYRGIA